MYYTSVSQPVLLGVFVLRDASPRALRKMTHITNKIKRRNWGPLDSRNEIDRTNKYTYNNIAMNTMYDAHG